MVIMEWKWLRLDRENDDQSYNNSVGALVTSVVVYDVFLLSPEMGYKK